MRELARKIETCIRFIGILCFVCIGFVLLTNPALLAFFIIAEYLWRTFVIPMFITQVSPTMKRMPMLIPWLCIPILGCYVYWEPSGWVAPDDPIHGFDPNSNVITPNCKGDWTILVMLRGTDNVVLTNAIMDTEFHRSKKGICFTIPYWPSKEVLRTWVKHK